MLPTSASTRRSWTSSPNRAAHERADRVAGVAPGEQRLERPARALPRHDSRRLVARRNMSAGTPSSEPLGDRVQAVDHTQPWRPSATSGRRRGRPRAASAVACGTRARNASAPSSTAASPANGVVRILPPSRSSASRSSIAAAGRRRRPARGRSASPVMPPPTTRTRAVIGRATTRSASAPRTAGSAFIDAVRANAQPGSAARCAPRCRGRRAPRGGRRRSRTGTRGAAASRRRRSSSTTARTSGPIHGSGVRPADCHADRPASIASPAAAATAVGGGAQLVGVGIAGGEDALRAASGR